MGNAIDRWDVLIADSSTLFRFFEAGEECTRKFMKHCGGRLYVVHDVAEEIIRYRDNANLADGIRVFRELLKNEPITPPPEVTLSVARILRLNKKYSFGDEDEGETATVLYAEWARENEGHEFLILMRDNFGRTLAEDRRLPFMETQDLVVDLVCGAVLSLDEGELVYRQIYKDRFDRTLYIRQIVHGCPECAEDLGIAESES